MIDELQAETIKNSIHECKLCAGLSKNGSICIENKEVGLDYSYPPAVPIQVMFVAESPPAPGKGFFYDQNSENTMFRNKLFKLINHAGLGPLHTVEDFSRKGYYLADALNCRWDKKKGSSLPDKILFNCSVHLSSQIRFFKPRYIVAMGKYAQKAVQLEGVQKSIKETGIPEGNIISMSFILVAPNESDEQRIEKLKAIVVA